MRMLLAGLLALMPAVSSADITFKPKDRKTGVGNFSELNLEDDENFFFGVDNDITCKYDSTNDVLSCNQDEAGAAASVLRLDRTSDSPADDDSMALEFASENDQNIQVLMAEIRALSVDVSTQTEDGALAFYTMRASTSTEAMRLDENGNLGISTTTPEAPLHVVSGSAGTVSPGANSDEFVVEGSGNTGISILAPDGSNQTFAFGSPTDSVGAQLLYNHNSALLRIGTEVTNGEVRFDYGTGSEGMRIDSSGNVGIGDNDMTAGPLQVQPPAEEIIAAGATITADGCGTMKSISTNDGGAVTTDTTNTFTAPAEANDGCCMDVVNTGGTDNITLDNNANFVSQGASDVVMTPNDAVRVCSNGSAWYQITDLNAN